MFKEMIMQALQEKYPEYEFGFEDVKCTNGTTYKGITVKLGPDVPLAPIIPYEFYENMLKWHRWSMEQVVDDIGRILDERLQIDSIDYSDYQKVKERIVIRLINYERNAEDIKRQPHRRFLDLAIVYRVVVIKTEQTEGSVPVVNEMCEHWNITEEELFEAAYQNTFGKKGIRIRNISSVVERLAKECGDNEILEVIANIPKEREFMFIADNGTEANGASCILEKDALRRFAEEKNADLYLLPSSIHEIVIACKKEGILVEDLACLVDGANQCAVAERDILSNHVYMYSREEDRILDLCA